MVQEGRKEPEDKDDPEYKVRLAMAQKEVGTIQWLDISSRGQTLQR